VFGVWVAGTAESLCTVDLRGAVPSSGMRCFAIELDQLGVIDVGAESCLDGFTRDYAI
jgi:hypothetical protein